jgi:hypothetical protein
MTVLQRHFHDGKLVPFHTTVAWTEHILRLKKLYCSPGFSWLKNFLSFKFTNNIIDWDKCFQNSPRGTSTFVSLDGTDFTIMEPTEFDPKCWSHKFNCSVLCYELAFCIHTGDKVLVNGGLPFGEWPDLRFARNAAVFTVEMWKQPGGRKYIFCFHISSIYLPLL